jgi:hypothetical protein
MIKTRSEAIDGKTVSVTQLPGRRALRLKTRLIKLAAPVMGKLFDSLPTEKKGKRASVGTSFDISAAHVGGALEKLAEYLTPDEYESLILETLSGTRIDGTEITPVSFDMMFGGELLFMYKVFWFSLRVQYEDFFENSGIGNILSQVKMPTQV